LVVKAALYDDQYHAWAVGYAIIKVEVRNGTPPLRKKADKSQDVCSDGQVPPPQSSEIGCSDRKGDPHCPGLSVDTGEMTYQLYQSLNQGDSHRTALEE
jgi:hypothetical protein